jgi:hypothetical protein
VSAARVAAAVDPDAARREATRILSDRRYRSAPTPRPLRGPLKWLGDRLESLFRPIGHFIQSIPIMGWALIVAAVVAGIVWLVLRAQKRRLPRATGSKNAGRSTADESEDPDALERAAGVAERDGDLARAVRLRFRAGLLRLGDRGAIRYRPSVTTGEVRRTLSSHRFDDLAGTFEEVTYGGRAAERPDVDTARREWPNVLEEAGRR